MGILEDSPVLSAVKPSHNSVNLLRHSARFVLSKQNKVLKKKITAESRKNSIYEGKVGLNIIRQNTRWVFLKSQYNQWKYWLNTFWTGLWLWDKDFAGLSSWFLEDSSIFLIIGHRLLNIFKRDGFHTPRNSISVYFSFVEQASVKKI